MRALLRYACQEEGNVEAKLSGKSKVERKKVSLREVSNAPNSGGAVYEWEEEKKDQTNLCHGE